MTDSEARGSGFDAVKPSAARMYDYLLSGKDNLQVDRDAVDELLAGLPEIRDGAEVNRGFSRRAARWMAEQGVDQFVDLGSGLPTQQNTDEVVHRINPDAKVAFVDLDPMVLAHVRELGEPHIAAIQADLREPEKVLAAVRGLLDLSRPVGVLAVAAFHFVTDEYRPREIVRTYMDAVPPGSYMAISHLFGEGQAETSVQRLKAAWAGTATGIHFRTREQVTDLFGDLRIVPPYEGAEPDLVFAGEWGAEDLREADSDGSRWVICGVGKKE